MAAPAQGLAAVKKYQMLKIIREEMKNKTESIILEILGLPRAWCCCSNVLSVTASRRGLREEVGALRPRREAR